MTHELDQMLLLVVPVLISILVTFFVTKFLISYLTKHGSVVQDMPKPGKVMIPRPGGPALIAGMVAGGLATYAVFPMTEYLVLLLSIGIGFGIGFIDDRKVMKGWFKPVMLIVASLPLLIFVMDDGLSIPWYGMVTVPVLYALLIIATMPLIGNTSNSLDVYNGLVTTSFGIAFAVMFMAYGLSGGQEEAVIGIPIIVSLLVFRHFHRLPTRIFPGDSGAITIGVAYIGFAIVINMEIIAIIAIIPAILNSFIFLSSTKKIVEHRQLKGSAVGLTEDYKLKANREKAAVSIFRLMLAKGPLSERDISKQFYKMMGFSGFLAICVVGIESSLLVIPVMIAGVILFMIGNRHKRLYIMIGVTALLIVGMIVPVIGWFNETDPSVYPFRELLSVIIMLPVMAVFVGALVVMKRKLLKPLYKEFEPLE